MASNIERVISLRKLGCTCKEIMAHLNMSRSRVGTICRKAGMAFPKPYDVWTAEEETFVRANWGKMPARDVAAHLKRPRGSVHQHACKMGLSLGRHERRKPVEWREDLAAKLQIGMSESEIAESWGVSRRYVGQLIKKAGQQASGSLHERQRRRVAEKTKVQLAAAGVSSLGELRKVSYRNFAISKGWPGDLRPRAVQILELLFEHGLLNRRQICDMSGMPWKGSRKSLVSNDPEGSYLAHLMAKGFVHRSPKLNPSKAQGKRKGVGCGSHFYCLTDVARQMKNGFISKDVEHGKNNDACSDQRHGEIAGHAVAG